MVKVRAHHARDGVLTTIFFTKDDFAMKEISAPKLFLELDLQHQAAWHRALPQISSSIFL